MPIPQGLLEEYNSFRSTTDKSCLCHAPEASMYFGRDGIVSACCYSRINRFGRYPESSILELWTSARAVAMREAMRRNELPNGCELCAAELYARNFKNLLARQFDGNVRPVAPSGLLSRARSLFSPKTMQFPLRLDFELSNKCNLECAMCSGYFSSSIRAHREQLPPHPMVYDQGFVEQLVPFLPHLTEAKFLGGEPFLIDIYYEIWEHLIRLNPTCKITITTNGTVFTSKVKRVIEKLNCEIVVSLDSVVKSTYENIRRNATLEQTLANFQAFCDSNRRKGVSLSIAVCPMQSNAEELPSLIQFANQQDVGVFFNTVVFPAEHSIQSLPVAEQRRLAAFYRQAIPPSSGDLQAQNWSALEGFCRQIDFWIAERDAPSTKPADANPMLLRCREILTAEPPSSALAEVLRDVLHEGSVSNEGQLVQLAQQDSVASLKAYYEAVWKLGRILAADGLLPGMKYNAEEEGAFLSFLETSVDEEKARRMHMECRRVPQLQLQYVGTLSAAGLIELVCVHFAVRVAAPA